MGDKIAEIQQNLPSVSYHANRVFSSLENNPDRLNMICDMQIYDADKTAGALIADRENVNLRRDYGLDSDNLMYSLKHAAMNGEKLSEQEIMSDKDPVISALLNEYASYKLAALVATDAIDNVAALGFAVMIG
jgi:hypothetical protein